MSYRSSLSKAGVSLRLGGPGRGRFGARSCRKTCRRRAAVKARRAEGSAEVSGLGRNCSPPIEITIKRPISSRVIRLQRVGPLFVAVSGLLCILQGIGRIRRGTLQAQEEGLAIIRPTPGSAV